MAPGSPTARRRRRRRCWRALRNIRRPRYRQDRRAPTPRGIPVATSPSGTQGLPRPWKSVAVRGAVKDRSAWRRPSRCRSTSRLRRRTPMGCRPHPASRSRAGRVSRRPTVPGTPVPLPAQRASWRTHRAAGTGRARRRHRRRCTGPAAGPGRTTGTRAAAAGPVHHARRDRR